ncbi:phosphonate C-P lyase system protein PhnG, partial [Serratia marcescens]|uniref:phosphonate C-P lyase system protein PhnG n=1 Tax=Serratia marcescens TaxID=615 RepID=UPI0011E966DF
IGLAQLQGRMGATGRRFVLGDMTVTRAVVQLDNGGYGYSYIAASRVDFFTLVRGD